MGILAARFTTDRGFGEQVWRFAAGLFDGRVDSLDFVVYGGILLGVICGVLGAFVVLRRQSLLGDAIGHSVLPGVCLGFLAAGGRSLPVLLAGALVAGVLAAVLISVLQRTTRLKSGECMGLVFTGFYGLGIFLLRHISRSTAAGKSGLEKFLWGQIVGLTGEDVVVMGVIAAASLGMVAAFWRPLASSSFDEDFAASQGVPVRWIQYALTVLLTVAIIVSIQAVGVILVSAMLIIPAATAYLLTDRLYRMVLLSAAIGALAGVLGSFFSFAMRDAPTGAFMVLAATVPFLLAFLLSRRHGLVPRLVRIGRRRRTTQAENLLRTLYVMLERRGGLADRRFGVAEVAACRSESPAFVRRAWRLAARRGWIEPRSRDPIVLTDAGLAEARRVTRNHRLWELFLANEAQLSAEAVHADAEQIEHVLPPDVLRRLEEMLERTDTDPHGRAIPPAAPAQEGAA